MRPPFLSFPGSSGGKVSAYNTGDPGWISGLGRSPGEGNSNPLQYSCLENPMDQGACRATVHGGRKESDMTERLHFHFPKIERRGFPGGPVVESLPAKAGDTGSVPGPGRSHVLKGS